MPDILICEVPDEVIGALDRNARRLGLSRTEYLRHILVHESTVAGTNATLEDWRSLAERHADLDDPEVMRQTWT